MNTSFTDKILCVGLRTSCLGTTAQDREATAKVAHDYDAEDGNYSVNKKILRDAIKPARQRRSAVRKWFKSMTLPGISEDLRITTPDQLLKIQEEIARVRDEDAEWLAGTFIPDYAANIDRDRPRLGAGFDPSLYPPVEDLAGHFDILLTVTDMPQGDYARVQGLTTATQAKMKEEHQKMLVSVGNQARNEVFRRLTEQFPEPKAGMTEETIILLFHFFWQFQW